MQSPSGANLDYKMVTVLHIFSGAQYSGCPMTAKGPRTDNSYSEMLTPGQGLELNSDTNSAQGG